MEKPLVIVTGASSGIGAAIAKLFHQQGYPLALLARNIQALEDLKLTNALCFSVDVTDRKAFTNAVRKAEEIFGSVDCLINNAGLAVIGEFDSIAPEKQDAMVDVNVRGVINGIEAVLPSMKAKMQGTVINMSSLADRKARPMLCTYAATKAAVKSLTESLRAANAKFNVRFCNIAPAKIRTKMLRSMSMLDEDVMEPEELAKVVLWIYEQPQHLCVRDVVFAPTSYEP